MSKKTNKQTKEIQKPLYIYAGGISGYTHYTYISFHFLTSPDGTILNKKTIFFKAFTLFLCEILHLGIKSPQNAK